LTYFFAGPLGLPSSFFYYFLTYSTGFLLNPIPLPNVFFSVVTGPNVFFSGRGGTNELDAVCCTGS